MSDTAYYCHNPLHPYATIHTESVGDIVPTGGHFTTSNVTLAQELKDKMPYMIVREHDKRATSGRARTITWTIPELPWKRAAQELPQETEHGAVTPQEEVTDG